jgi:hypothetical protein
MVQPYGPGEVQSLIFEASWWLNRFMNKTASLLSRKTWGEGINSDKVAELLNYSDTLLEIL